MAPSLIVLLAGPADGPYDLRAARDALVSTLASRAPTGTAAPPGAPGHPLDDPAGRDDRDHGDNVAPPHQVVTLDLATGPTLTRAKAALGIGWHTRDQVLRIERELGRRPDLLVELGGTPHHLLGLGRTGAPAGRVVVAPPTAGPFTPDAMDRLAADEGACLLIPQNDDANTPRFRGDVAWLTLPLGDDPYRTPWADWWPRVLDALLPREPWRRLVARR